MIEKWLERIGGRGIGALSTTRAGGVSAEPFDSLNLGLHVGDDPDAVRENRRILTRRAGGDVRFAWLEQVHGTRLVDAAEVVETTEIIQADASLCRVPGIACVVMTADCLPVLFCDRAGSVVAAAHAGWRGLAAGVLEQTIEAMEVSRSQIQVWMGPAIGPEVFEVGPEVRQSFLSSHPKATTHFKPSPANPDDRFVADLYGLARLRLTSAGVSDISGGGECTFSDERFFSYRRDQRTGRMATAVWLK